MELVDRKTFEPVNHIYVYLLWRDSLQKGLNVIKFEDKHRFTSWMFCRSFVYIFDNYTKTEITNKNLVKPPHINEGDTYQFSNITLYDSCGMSSFDFVNEVNKTEALSGLQFYLYTLQFCLLDLENEARWR